MTVSIIARIKLLSDVSIVSDRGSGSNVCSFTRCRSTCPSQNPYRSETARKTRFDRTELQSGNSVANCGLCKYLKLSGLTASAGPITRNLLSFGGQTFATLRKAAAFTFSRPLTPRLTGSVRFDPGVLNGCGALSMAHPVFFDRHQRSMQRNDGLG